MATNAPPAMLLLLTFATALSAATRRDEHDPPALELPRARALFTATPLGGDRFLVVGGMDRKDGALVALRDGCVVDLAADDGRGRVSPAIATSGGLFGARANHAAAALGKGSVLIAGGSLAGVERFDRFDRDAGPDGSFHPVGALPGGARAALTATALADGRVLLAGGKAVSGKDSVAVDLFVPPGTLVAAAPLRRARSSHTATLLADGRVLVAGGVGRDCTELFDAKSGTWSDGPRMSSVRDDHRATRLADGRVLLAGGQDASARSLASADLFDPANDAITPAGAMADARSDHAQVLLADGTVLVLGGERDDGADHDVVLASVERFDPTTGRFSACAPLAGPRDDGQAVLAGDGRVAVIGGFGTGDAPLASIEIYRPAPPGH